MTKWAAMCENSFSHVYLIQTQTSLCICQFDQSSLSTWRNFTSLAIQHVPSEDSDQTMWMHRLIWIFPGPTCPKVCFLRLQSKWCLNIYDAQNTKRALMQSADKAGPDPPAHSRKLIWAIVACLHNQWIL